MIILQEKIQNKLFQWFGLNRGYLAHKRNWYLSEVSWASYWNFGIKRCRWGTAYNYDVLVIHFFNLSLYITMPPLKECDDCSGYTYGFYFDRNKNLFDFLDFVFRWGKYHYRFEFPYISMRYEKTEILDGKRNVLWVEPKNKHGNHDLWKTNNRIEEAIKKEFAETFDYVYYLNNGEVQERTATVNVGRRTYHRKWFPWLKKVYTFIDVTFNDEVGERTGSWKGGTVGCSYDLLPDETPEQCLRRMEKERVFK